MLTKRSPNFRGALHFGSRNAPPLTFTLRSKFYSVTIQMKLLQRHFHMVPFVFQYKYFTKWNLSVALSWWSTERAWFRWQIKYVCLKLPKLIKTVIRSYSTLACYANLVKVTKGPYFLSKGRLTYTKLYAWFELTVIIINNSKFVMNKVPTWDISILELSTGHRRRVACLGEEGELIHM